MVYDRKFKLRQTLLLLLTALIWGTAFAAQSIGMDYVGPFTFIGVRFAIGALTLVPFIAVQEIGRKKEIAAHPGAADAVDLIDPAAGGSGRAMSGPLLWKAGILCGIALFTASSLQQVGIQYTTVGKAGFLTAMYIVIVPILGMFFGRRVKLLIWVSVLIAVGGLYLLCMGKGTAGIAKGDALCLSCAFVFAIQIMIIDHYSETVDGLRMSAVQFLTVSVLGIIMMLIFEKPSAAAIWQARSSILYTGVLSSGVAYTLQIIAQRGMNPTIASLLMSLESPISAISGFLILHQIFSGRELAGCLLMAAAIVLSQLAH